MRTRVSNFFMKKRARPVPSKRVDANNAAPTKKRQGWQSSLGTPVQAALQQQVEAISMAAFNRPFTHQAVYNARLQTTGGRYHLKDHHLDFNPKMKEQEDFEAIIKHELCHYHLHLAGRGYKHADADFKGLLKQVGGSRYAPDIGARRKVQRKYHYACSSGHTFDRARPVDTKRYRCGRCRGRLSLIKKDK